MNQDNSNLTEQQRIERIAGHFSQIISLLGEDTDREGLLKTPMRAAKALWHITSGYRTDPAATLSAALFEHEGSNAVIVRDIEFYSTCEYHILPFFGHISVAYIPGDKIVGLSKIARVVDICARKLQVQERLTREVADVIAATLGARGVFVLCSAQHMCMKMRGVEKQDSCTVTTHYNGLFESDPDLRREILQQLRTH